MKGSHFRILIAAYPDLDVARKDFGVLTDRAKHKRFEIRDALLVTKDADGHPQVAEGGNHLGRQGAGWGVGIGILVGLFAPPMLATMALGALAGAAVAKFADHELRTGLRHEVGRVVDAGTAVVIVLLPPASELSVRQVLVGSPAKTVLAMDDSTIGSVEDAVALKIKELEIKQPELNQLEHEAPGQGLHPATADNSGTSS